MMPPESAATSSRSSTGLAGERVADRRRDLEHFVDRRDAGGDLHRAADAQGLHAFLHRLLSQRRDLGVFRGQRFDGARKNERFVDSDPPQIAGHAAFEAADRLADLRRAVRFPRPDERVPRYLVLAALQIYFLLAMRAQR